LRSIDDNECRPDPGVRAMRFGIVRDLIAHAGPECESAAILQFRVELAGKAQEDVSLGAPVVRHIAGVYSTMRTRTVPNCRVRQYASPRSP
jgi:hypothetical protein